MIVIQRSRPSTNSTNAIQNPAKTIQMTFRINEMPGILPPVSSTFFPNGAIWAIPSFINCKAHGTHLFDYVCERGGRVRLSPIGEVDVEFNGIVDVFDKVLAHEQKVTGLINNLVDISQQESDHGFLDNFLRNNSIPLWLVIFGSLGQVIFTLRFIYQWIYSMKKKESLLPLGFWIISLIGSGIIVLYGIIRFDLILILGQSVGFIAYARNISIYKKGLIVTYNVE